MTSPMDAQQQIAAGFALRRAGDVHGAERMLLSAVGQIPQPTVRASLLAYVGAMQVQRGNFAAAVRHLEEALSVDADHPSAHGLLGTALSGLSDRLEDALRHLDAAFAANPTDGILRSHAAIVRLKLGIWDGTGMTERTILDAGRTDPASIAPFNALFFDFSAAELRAIAETYARQWPHRALRDEIPNPHGRRLRIGYLSHDFREHPTSHLIVRLLERHDRDRVEVRAYSTGADDRSAIRTRILAAVDGFVDLSRLSDADAIRRIEADAIDILVDLNGPITGWRPEIPAARPAAVQMVWLGFPGTTGAPWYDHAIVDPVVVPVGQEQGFTEPLIRLRCYQCNDDRPPIAAAGPRSAHGLPDDGVVFVSFNQHAKINPGIFDLWCAILRSTPSSMLWLLQPRSAAAVDRLRSAAAERGVDPSRLVFAPHAGRGPHLARLGLADIALDTRPYGSHTTATDALWMGVPLITWPGATFQTRVAASLLGAAGLNALVVDGPDAYVRLACALADDADRRRSLRSRLLTDGRASRLFDMASLAGELEAAFREAVERKASSASAAVRGA